MQPLKNKFKYPDGSQHSSFQKCIRTNDIKEVGDGSHLTSFTMVGTFGFGTNNYEYHCTLWDRIIDKLGITVSSLQYHPDSSHKQIWSDLGYNLQENTDCTWKQNDKDEPSFCSEMFVGDLEIGNLVNPNLSSIDVGFGLERLVQIVEGKEKVDETSLFDHRLNSICKDHLRTISLLHSNGIRPGNKGRNYTYRRLLRKVMRENLDVSMFQEYGILDTFLLEQSHLDKRISDGRKHWKKFKDRDNQFWWESFGILPEEIELLQ